MKGTKNMFEWKIEENALNTERANFNTERYTNQYIFKAERITLREDKIAFVDSLTKDTLSYIINLSNRLEAERDAMPKDQYGRIKTVSLKAWLKCNDSRQIIYPYHADPVGIGKVVIFFDKDKVTTSTSFELRYIQDIKIRGGYDTHDDFVDEAFHIVLHRLCDEERKYFNEHDETAILMKKTRDVLNEYGSFGALISYGSSGINVCSNEDRDKERPVTVPEMKELIAKADKVKAFVEKLSQNPIKY